MSIFVRIARILFLVAFCSAAFADMRAVAFRSIAAHRADSAPATHPEAANKSNSDAMLQFASLAPELAERRQASLRSTEPFDLPGTAAPDQDLQAKWNELQTRILADERTLAACRSNESTCSPAERRFLSIIELGRKSEGRARLGSINRAINLSIRPTSDWAQYGIADFWASPLQTLASGAGDCEDYAIAKYVALRELGIAPGDLRFVVVRDDKRQTDHAIVAVRNEQRWLVLDNRTMAIYNAEDASHYHALFASDQQGSQPVVTASADRITNR